MKPNITDKEAGMLSMEAFLSLYDSTKDAKWSDRRTKCKQRNCLGAHES